MILVQQRGRDHHEHICESLEPFARGVLERDDERERDKHETLAPHVEPAMVRRQWLRALADDDLPEVQAYGRPMSDGNWPAVVAAGGILIPTRGDA